MRLNVTKARHSIKLIKKFHKNIFFNFKYAKFLSKIYIFLLKKNLRIVKKIQKQ